jgi:hypothetical protein
MFYCFLHKQTGLESGIKCFTNEAIPDNKPKEAKPQLSQFGGTKRAGPGSTANFWAKPT